MAFVFIDLTLHSRNLYQNFASPWADTQCRPQDIDYHVPQVRGDLLQPDNTRVVLSEETYQL